MTIYIYIVLYTPAALYAIHNNRTARYFAAAAATATYNTTRRHPSTRGGSPAASQSVNNRCRVYNRVLYSGTYTLLTIRYSTLHYVPPTLSGRSVGLTVTILLARWMNVWMNGWLDRSPSELFEKLITMQNQLWFIISSLTSIQLCRGIGISFKSSMILITLFYYHGFIDIKFPSVLISSPNCSFNLLGINYNESVKRHLIPNYQLFQEERPTCSIVIRLMLLDYTT